MGIFKAYDIRGKVPSELNPEIARKIGTAFAKLLSARRIVVGQDMRTHSPAIAEAVIEGIRDTGCDVTSIGLASTPMAYFAIGSNYCDGGLNVTASHNPAEYNGMKLCGRGATPISAANGILELERMVAGDLSQRPIMRGRLEPIEMLDRFADHVAKFAHIRQPISVAIDAANGMAGYTLPPILARLPKVRATTAFMELDGTFPNHEANPLKEENLATVKQLVVGSSSALGVSFDGDADRCGFVDERGRTVGNDLMTALLAREILMEKPGAAVVYDLRSSWVVPEEIRRAGGVPIRDRVGHSFIKATMRANDAVFGGELSGHYYFKENYTCDSGEIAMISALNLLGNLDRPLSKLAADLRRYSSTGEINFQVDDKEAAIARLREVFSDGKQDELDGITVEYGQLGDKSWWWFNVRPSNTESLLRLNLEASDRALRDEKRAVLVDLLGSPHE
jgi:phosphomannomutase